MAQNLYIYFCLEKIYDIKESMNFRFIRVTFSKFLKQVVEHILGSCVILFFIYFRHFAFAPKYLQILRKLLDCYFASRFLFS